MNKEKTNKDIFIKQLIKIKDESTNKQNKKRKKFKINQK